MKHQKQKPAEAAVLARTAELEQELGVGNWRDTLDQLDTVLARMAGPASQQVSEIELVRRQLGRLRAVLHRRDDEVDRYEELISAYQNQLRSLGCTDFPQFTRL